MIQFFREDDIRRRFSLHIGRKRKKKLLNIWLTISLQLNFSFLFFLALSLSILRFWRGEDKWSQAKNILNFFIFSTKKNKSWISQTKLRVDQLKVSEQTESNWSSCDAANRNRVVSQVYRKSTEMSQCARWCEMYLCFSF